jgi:hypothetical protein
VARKIFLAHEFAGGDLKAGGNKQRSRGAAPACISPFNPQSQI